MGCGTGALSVPLGQAGHTVVAADFSAGMLGVLREELDAHGVTSVFPKQMSWEDDWAACGVGPESADVSVASRSIAVADLREALLRLTDVARRRVCITLATGSSPRTDERVLQAIGLSQSVLGRDYLYAFNILAARGIKAEAAYIESTRSDTFDSLDEACEDLGRMVEDSAAFVPRAERDAALARLRPWLEGQLVENLSRAGLPDRKGVPERALRLPRSPYRHLGVSRLGQVGRPQAPAARRASLEGDALEHLLAHAADGAREAVRKLVLGATRWPHTVQRQAYCRRRGGPFRLFRRAAAFSAAHGPASADVGVGRVAPLPEGSWTPWAASCRL